MGCASSEPAVKSTPFEDAAACKQSPPELVAQSRLGNSLDNADTPKIQALKKDQTQYTDTSEALSSLLKSSNEVVIASKHFKSSRGIDSSLHNALQSSGNASTKEKSGQEFSKGLEQLGVQVQDGAVSQDLMEQVLAIVKSNQQIGEGSFGTVYKGHIEGVDVAVKTIRYRDVASARDEILASMALDHPNLVRTYLAFQHQYKKPKHKQHDWDSESDDDEDEFQPINLNEQRKQLEVDPLGDWDADDTVDDGGSTTDDNVNEMYIVQEFCNLGDLQGMIVSGKLSGEAHLKRCLMISLDVANALTYMHKYKVLHLDLKPQNVLLSMKEGDRRPVCKIADFGVSRAMPSDMGTINTGRCGTAVYCPVEMVMNGQVSPTADVYSLALIMGEMMSGKLLYADISIAQAVVAVVNNGMRPELGDWVPEQLKALLRRSWGDDRTQRPTAKQFAAELRSIVKALSNMP